MGKVKVATKLVVKKAAKAQAHPQKKMKLAKAVSTKSKVASQPVEKHVELKPTTENKPKVSTKLLEVIQERKKKQAGDSSKSNFGKPMGRRGRRPKNLSEYTPENQEDDMYNFEQEQVSLEYDAGIRVSKPAHDDNVFNLDRFEDYDEELNFDWK